MSLASLEQQCRSEAKALTQEREVVEEKLKHELHRHQFLMESRQVVVVSRRRRRNGEGGFSRN